VTWPLLALLLAQPVMDPADAGALEPEPLVSEVAVVDAGTPLVVHFEGNVALPDAVFAHVLALPPGATADAETAQLVAAQLLRFLQQSGYELAEVSVRQSGDALTAFIDEGQLEKVVFRGRFTLPMLRFKLALDLPKDVFNRPHLEREVARRAKELGLEPPHWELVPSKVPPHEGVQLSTSPGLVLAGRPLFHPRHAYELHFTFGEPSWSTGVGFDLRTSWLDGLELGLNYQGRSVALGDDRWRFAFTAGLGLRNDLPRNNVYAFPSRLTADVLWYSAPVDVRGTTRGLLRAHGEGVFRQRRDFGLENYSAMRTELSANLVSKPHPLVSFEVSSGLEYFLVGALVPGEGQLQPLPRYALGPPSSLDEPTRLRAFGGARLDFTFFDGDSRWDRRHALSLEGRLSGNITRFDLPAFLELRFNYQLVIPFGWHDLWFRAKGTWMSGDVLFPYEEVMGEHLPAVFGDIWLRKVAGLRVEYRYSLVRDVFKVGFFANGIAFAEEQRDTGGSTPRFGGGVGPTAHFLIEGFVQIDLFLNFTLLSNGRFATGLLVWVNKVF
jgi:hypothetical protein